VPVTARFSSRFYERLGDDVAEELVNWFNSVDQDYRNQLNATNERNWLAFRAELRGSMAELRAELIKWMFGFWVAFWLATVIPLGGLILTR
jgi:hypothetical protein